ncbi:hypothetical protein [Oerskovia jenensis]|uniref:hypothetical protein n=1 Tax=Oerskovia jenensis TaxID=162169 RepID=UPI0036DF4745
MSSARTPRAPRPIRADGRGRDPSAPPPAVAELLARRGWVVVEQGEEPGPDRGRPGRWVVSDGAGSSYDVGLVPVPAEPAARDVLVERLDTLRLLDHEHLAQVEEILEGGEGALVLVSRRPPGGSLRLLLGCRGPFDAGEAVTLLVPLSRALAALHACGLSYGGVGASDVLVDAAGRAVLRTPLDLCARPAPDDVGSLAELVAGVLPPPAAARDPGHVATETSDPHLEALHAELAAACRADLRTRPEVGTLGALCYEAAHPRPIAMPDGARLAAAAIAARPRTGSPRRVVSSPGPDGPTDDTVLRPPRTPGGSPTAREPAGPGGQGLMRRHGHRAGSRRSAPGPRRHPAVVAGLVLTVCAVLVGGGLVVRSHLADEDAGAQARHDADRVAAADDARSDPTLRAGDPAGAAAELTERRIELLTGEREPAEVLAPGSPAAAVDADLLARVTASGLVIEGASASVVETRRVETGEDPQDPAPGAGPSPSPGVETQVEVTYSVSAHTQRASDGTATTVAATEPSTARLTLRWTDAGWRVSDVA